MIFRKQRDAMDRGPSCLVMLAKYYGKDINVKQLRKIYSLGKEGVSLREISKAAEHLNFRTIGGKLNFSSLMTEAPLPCIVHWNQNHFVVVHEIKINVNGNRY